MSIKIVIQICVISAILLITGGILVTQHKIQKPSEEIGITVTGNTMEGLEKDNGLKKFQLDPYGPKNEQDTKAKLILERLNDVTIRLAGIQGTLEGILIRMDQERQERLEHLKERIESLEHNQMIK